MRDSILQDLRFAGRAARRNPGFTATAVCTLALGIGANATIFSIVSGVLLRPLPFADPDRLVELNQVDARFGMGPVPYADLVEFRKESAVFEEIVSYGSTSKSLLDLAEPERIQTVWAERRLFRMLGVAPILGRTFQDDDPLGVVVVSAGFWRRRLGGALDCLGRKIRLDGEPYTVIGVMPATFQFPYRASLTELWIPWELTAAMSRNLRVDHAAARLQPGLSVRAAGEKLAAMATMASPAPVRRTVMTPYAEVVAGHARTSLLILLGAVALILLIACVNVANMLLARGSFRSREMAVRTALGASRGRLMRQLLTESVLLGAAGGFAGFLLSRLACRGVLALAGAAIPRSQEIGTDWRVFAFLLAACLGTGIAFGLAPAAAVSRVDLSAAIKGAGGAGSLGGGRGGWSGRRMRDGLVVVEVALSFVLLVSAVVTLRALLRLLETPAGMRTEQVLTLRLTVHPGAFGPPGAYGRYLEDVENRVRRVPGVRAAGFIQYLPLQNWGWQAGFRISGRPAETGAGAPAAELRYVTPGYFGALGIPIRKGRNFTARDTAASPRVILVNEALARRYFPNEDPVGRLTDRGEIVGIAGDVRTSRLDRPATPEIYYSFAQNPAATTDAGVSLVAATVTPPEGLASAVRAAIHEVNPREVVFDVKTMERVIANSLADVRLYVWLFGIFGGMAAALAAAGMYGVISFVAASRAQEFGLRMALGAAGQQIMGMVLAHGSRLVALGLLTGTAVSFGTARLLAAAVPGGGSGHPAAMFAAGLLLAGVALAACVAPARRAMRVDPAAALKYE